MYTTNTRFQEFPTVELTNSSRSYFSKEMVLISLYIKRRKKGGNLFLNTQFSAMVLFRERRLFD